jgi:putative hydrolase of the HAD superfamily
MIKNLLFDLGGVIMDIKRQNCVDAFSRLGLADADSFFGEYSQSGPFSDIEEGLISEEEFHAYMRPLLPVGTSDNDIDEAFCQFLVGIPVKRLADLRSLRNKYKVYMLSNTNPIMWKSRIREEFTHEGLTREDYFDGIVTSFEAKSLKPARKIFDYCASTLGINPTETLFLDDSQRNVEAAREAGYQAALVAPGNEFIDILKQLNLI